MTHIIYYIYWLWYIGVFQLLAIFLFTANSYKSVHTKIDDDNYLLVMAD